MASVHNRGGFIWLHQTVVLLSGIAGFKISRDGDFMTFFWPLFAGLFPLLLASSFYWREPKPDDAARIHTYVKSSLIGGISAIAIMACWAFWAAAMMLSGFH